MSLDTNIILAGALVAALPFLGFPSSWDRVILVILGIGIIALGIVVRRRAGSPAGRATTENDTFTESSPRAEEGHEKA